MGCCNHCTQCLDSESCDNVGGCDDCHCTTDAKSEYGGECRHCGLVDEYPERGADGKVCCWKCADKEKEEHG